MISCDLPSGRGYSGEVVCFELVQGQVSEDIESEFMSLEALLESTIVFLYNLGVALENLEPIVVFRVGQLFSMLNFPLLIYDS